MNNEKIFCVRCGEPIDASDLQHSHSRMHSECAFRSIMGSVAHIEKRCSCFILGSTAGDPEGMTKREAAQAAVAAFYFRRNAGKV